MEDILILSIELHDSGLGCRQQLEHLGQLASALQSKIEFGGIGEFDGQEFSQGVCALYV